MLPDRSTNGALQIVVVLLERLTVILHRIQIAKRNAKCSTEFHVEKIGKIVVLAINAQLTSMVTFVIRESGYQIVHRHDKYIETFIR